MPRNVPKTPGDRIRHAREEAGYSQIQLAVYAGVSRTTIQTLETVQTQESLDGSRLETLKAIANALEIPLLELLPNLEE